MGIIVDVVIGVLLVIVLLVNLFGGFRKFGVNNLFTLVNIVLSALLASVLKNALLNSDIFKSVIEGSGTGAELVTTVLGVVVFALLFMVLCLLFGIIFFFVKIPIKKANVQSKALKWVGRLVSVVISVSVYALFFWMILGVVHTMGLESLENAIGTSFFYAHNPLQSFCDQYLNVGGLIGSVTSIPSEVFVGKLL